MLVLDKIEGYSSKKRDSWQVHMCLSHVTRCSLPHVTRLCSPLVTKRCLPHVTRGVCHMLLGDVTRQSLSMLLPHVTIVCPS